MHDGMPYDPIQGQGQGHGTSKVQKIALFQKKYLLRHLRLWSQARFPTIYMSVVCRLFVSNAYRSHL